MPNPSVPACAIVIVAAATAPRIAAAEGELGPMLGGGLMATHSEEADVAGLGLELVGWHGRLGLAAEGSRQWSVDGVTQTGSVGASVRVLAFRHLVPSLLDSREVVELGIELHGIVERTWWIDGPDLREPVSYGLGLAVRLRGANDDDRSNLLAESRLFVRALSRRSNVEIAARGGPLAEPDGVDVIIGLGALFGGGQPDHIARLRRRSLDSEWLVQQ